MARKRTRRSTKKPWVVAVVLVLVAAGGLIALELTDTTHLLRSKPLESSTIPTTSPNGVDTSQDGEQPAQQPAPEPPVSDKNNIAVSSGGEVAAPYGTFISSHVISLSDPRAKNQESICITTPGANCKIEFKKDGVVKILDSKKAGPDGSVIWNWTPKDADLREGSWQIVATAWSDDDTKTTIDPMNLEVKP